MPDSLNYRQLFGVDVNLALSKADRLVYGDSLMTHAMILTACHFDSAVVSNSVSKTLNSTHIIFYHQHLIMTVRIEFELYP